MLRGYIQTNLLIVQSAVQLTTSVKICLNLYKSQQDTRILCRELCTNRPAWSKFEIWSLQTSRYFLYVFYSFLSDDKWILKTNCYRLKVHVLVLSFIFPFNRTFLMTRMAKFPWRHAATAYLWESVCVCALIFHCILSAGVCACIHWAHSASPELRPCVSLWLCVHSVSIRLLVLNNGCLNRGLFGQLSWEVSVRLVNFKQLL